MIKKIRIAILFTGHTKNWMSSIDSYYKFIENPLRLENIEIDKYLFSFTEQFPQKSSSLNNRSDLFNDENLLKSKFRLNNILLEEYDNNKFYIENFFKYNSSLDQELISCGLDPNHLDKYRGNGTLFSVPMLYQNYKGFSLLNNIYDIVIRSRPDLIFTQNLDLSLLEKCLLDKNLIVLGRERLNCDNYFAVDDHFALGSMYAMHKYCHAFHNLYLVFNKYKVFAPPERVLGKSLEIDGLEYFDYPQTLIIA